MGLITNAVDKVEQKEELPVIPETSPAPEERKRPGKRKLLLLLAPLVLVGVALILSYFLFLKQAPDEPPRTTRRSISARKQAAEPSAKPAAKIQEPGTIPASSTDKPEGGKETSGQASDSRAQARKPEAASRRGKKPAADQAKPEAQTAASQPSQAQTEPISASPEPKPKAVSETPKAPSENKNLEKSVVTSEIPAEQVPLTETDRPDEAAQQAALELEERLKTLGPPFTQPQDTEEALDLPQEALALGAETQPDQGDEIETSSPEQTVVPETTPIRPYQPGGTKAQRALEVSDRSEPRAERYYRKGVSYQQKGDLSSAIDAYRSALSYNPDHLQANMNLATAYLQTGRFKQAEQILVYLYASRPKDPKVLYNFGVLLYQTGEYVSAENKLKKLLEIDPFHLEANLLLATIYEDQGELDRAIAACMKAHQIYSSHPRVLYRLGRVWDLAGQPAQAVVYYQQFLNCRSEKDPVLELAVRDRLKYLGTRKEEP